jgi:hypothetical protein
MMRLSRKFLRQAGLSIGRLFFPVVAIAIIFGTMLWGPWVTLAMSALGLIAAMRFS